MNPKEHGHGNKVGAYSLDPNPPDVRKVPTSSVPYSDAITHRRFVWVVVEDERVVCAAATSEEVRRRYRL
jgi:hypothetical protein